MNNSRQAVAGAFPWSLFEQCSRGNQPINFCDHAQNCGNMHSRPMDLCDSTACMCNADNMANSALADEAHPAGERRKLDFGLSSFKPLRVPETFYTVDLNRLWGLCGQRSAAHRRRILGPVLVVFIQKLLEGVLVEVLLQNTSIQVVCSLDASLKMLKLRGDHAQRIIALNLVECICPAEYACTTLMLSGSDLVTLRFSSKEVRIYFETCLMILVDGACGSSTSPVSTGAK